VTRRECECVRVEELCVWEDGVLSLETTLDVSSARWRVCIAVCVSHTYLRIMSLD